jgi:opacity protein-like surface antigen
MRTRALASTLWIAVSVALLPASAVAQTRTSAAAAPIEQAHVEVAAQSSFGNVTSQAFGGEVAVTVYENNVQAFLEFARARDTTPASMGSAAQSVANALAQTQSNIGYSVKQPATFGMGGVRYLFPVSGSRLEPYVLAGIGIAHMSRNVTFTANGTDITPILPQLGVQLGSDLSGDATKFMVGFGGGIAYPAWQRLLVDVQFRYGRIADDPGINLARVGLGIGIQF